MSHPLALKSTYQDELPYTNYTFDFTGVIDYLWCSARHLVPVAILGPANEVCWAPTTQSWAASASPLSHSTRVTRNLSPCLFPRST